MSNIPTVQGIYAAFGKGDVPAIMNKLSESVDWEYGADNGKIPWLNHGTGHAAALAFFQAVTQLNITKLQPKALCEAGNIVIALLDLEAVVKSTGKQIKEEDEVHLWHFDGAGKVVKFRHRADTLQHYLANQQG